MSPLPASTLTESEFRALAHDLYRRVQAAFDEIDPDVAEVEESQGSLTIQLSDGARWILSLQPPVRQVWLAVASIGRAFHFDYDPESGTWRDDKGEGLELLAYLEDLLLDKAGIQVKLR